MPDPIFFPSAPGLVLGAARALRSLSGNQDAGNARFIANRSTPEGRASELSRRGEFSLAEVRTALLGRHSGGTSPSIGVGEPTIFDEAGLPTAPMLLAPPAPRFPGRIEESIPALPYVDPFLLVAQNLPVPTQPRSGGRFDPLERERRGARARAAQEAKMRQAAEALLRRLKIIKAGRVVLRAGGVAAGVLVPSELGEGVPTEEQVRQAEQRAREAQLEELQLVTVASERLPVPAAEPGQRVGPSRPSRVTARGGATSSTRSTPTSSRTPGGGGSIFSRLPWSQIFLNALLGSTRAPNVNVNLAPQASQNLTPIETAGVSSSSSSPPVFFSGSSGSTCECPPKKRRKPTKKCIEWAPIGWTGGRFKGKSAGRKCVRRET